MKPIEYLVTKIDGDYAHLKNIKTEDDILVAMALLPEETDEGIKLIWENFKYTVLTWWNFPNTIVIIIKLCYNY